MIQADRGSLPGEPLAARMRPATLDEIVGQDRILGQGRALRTSIEKDRVPSMILWGPPGCGKTTLAEVIAGATQSLFVPLSATSAGVADLRRAMEAADKLRSFSGQQTILFIDEIHRFNKSQQDAVLPQVERGVVTLIGATTENPSFEVNSALLSRTRVFRLEPLSEANVQALVRRALADPVRGLGNQNVAIEDETIGRLAKLANGDARVALNAIELAASATVPETDGTVRVTDRVLEDVLQRSTLLYDKSGDMHYDLISAFIKSVRGSDPDAAVYWLARMLEAGEDPLFVARRMFILASEDIGLAEPQALPLAAATFQAVHAIGMPESYLPLTECALYLALCPKSNSAIVAYGNARAAVAEHLSEPVPLHLRNAVTALGRAQGFGAGYRYAHDFDGHFVHQEYLPADLVGQTYYEPGGEGKELRLAEELRRKRDRAQ